MRRTLDRLETAGWDEQPTVADFGAEDTAVSEPVETIDTPLGPGSIVDAYEIERLVGQGGMARVYTAVDVATGLRVAIKVLRDVDASACARFEQEAAAVNEIGHGNIVDVFAMGTLPDGRPYMVMEWLDGRDLAHELATGAMAIAGAVDVLDQVADALQAAHAQNIAHRDLKPDNVFVTRAGDRRIVKLLDFGIAKLLGDRNAPRHTREGRMVGTPGYVSPEQARGFAIDHRADIYSLGMLAYQMLCGRLPFDGACDMDLVVRQLTQEPPPPSVFRRDVPRGLDRLVHRMIDREPDRRPSLAEVRAALGQLRAARGARRSDADRIAEIPSLAMSPARTPTPMPKFRAVGTPPPPHCPEVRVTFRPPTAPAAATRWKARVVTAGVFAVLTAAAAIVTAYLA